MNSRPPENPPLADFHPPLVDYYPPHGFPPYLGLGLLDTASLRLDRSESVAEYRQGGDLVYRVSGSFDPTANDGATTACGATHATWEIEEFSSGKPWRKTTGYQSLPQAFFHHLVGQLPTENPRVAAVLRRLTQDYLVAVRCKHRCSNIMFPAGYVYAIRVPLTDETFDNFKAFASQSTDELLVPWAAVGEPQSVVILKATKAFETQFERGVVSDVRVPLFRLTETLDRLLEAKASAEVSHLRPEIIYADENHWKFSQVHPGRLRDGVVTYKVIPIANDTPSPTELEEVFSIDSVETFFLVDEAFHAEPPEEPSRAQA